FQLQRSACATRTTDYGQLTTDSFSFFTFHTTAQAQDQQSVAVVALDFSAFNRAGEAQRLLEAAVSDFELVIGDGLLAESIAARTRQTKDGPRDLDLNLFRLHARQINFNQPAVLDAIHVRCRRPLLPRRRLPVRRVQQTKITLD